MENKDIAKLLISIISIVMLGSCQSTKISTEMINQTTCSSADTLHDCIMELRRVNNTGDFDRFESLFAQICGDKRIVCHESPEESPHSSDDFTPRKVGDSLFSIKQPDGLKILFFISKK